MAAPRPTSLKHLRLTDAASLERHMQALLKRDARLKRVADIAGPFEVRLTAGGFAGLARVICGQQVSVASARAIFGRLAAVKGALDAATYLTLDDAALSGVGLSASKARTLRAVAEAIVGGAIDFAALEQMEAEAAVEHLSAHRGIGPWTAEIYLMFCVGHPDVFPVGDLALRKAVGHAFALGDAPAAADIAAVAANWAPHRHAAALLFWTYYAQTLRKAGGIAL